MIYSNIQKQILQKLLTKYESSKTYKGENSVSQTFSIKPSDIFKEYEKDFVYSKSTPFCKKANRVYKTEIVEFLLHPYLNKGFDINSLITIIRETEIPTAIKFSLMDLIEEYKSTNELKIWKDYNFADLAFILKQYLNLDSEYNKITSQYTNMKQVRIKLDVILKERFKNDLYRAFLYYVEMCYVRNNALYEDWRKTF